MGLLYFLGNMTGDRSTQNNIANNSSPSEQNDEKKDA